MNIPDDPIISAMENTGYPPWHREEEPCCPICGSECRIVYKDNTGDIVGCDECLTPCNASQEEECFKGWSE